MFAFSKKFYTNVPSFPLTKLVAAMFSSVAKYAYQVALSIKLPNYALSTDGLTNEVHKNCIDFLVQLERDYPKYSITAIFKDKFGEITYKTGTSYGVSILSSAGESAIKMINQKLYNPYPIPSMMNMIINIEKTTNLPMENLSKGLLKNFLDFQLKLQQDHNGHDILTTMNIIEPTLSEGYNIE